MNIRIIKCSLPPPAWYAGAIGETFHVEGQTESGRGIVVRSADGTLRDVLEVDAEPVLDAPNKRLTIICQESLPDLLKMIADAESTGQPVPFTATEVQTIRAMEEESARLQQAVRDESARLTRPGLHLGSGNRPGSIPSDMQGLKEQLWEEIRRPPSAQQRDQDLLDWAEAFICNAIPMPHCHQEEWDVSVKAWRDRKHRVGELALTRVQRWQDDLGAILAEMKEGGSWLISMMETTGEWRRFEDEDTSRRAAVNRLIESIMWCGQIAKALEEAQQRGGQ